MKRATVIDVRNEFARLLGQSQFTTDKSGSSVIEIVPADFEAGFQTIFGEVNWDYVQREIDWYESMSLNVNDIRDGAPEAWKRAADPEGFVNSNYGWALWHPDNFSQYQRARDELARDPDSRRACMIVTRPSMWLEYNKNGRSDFSCTWGYTFRVRDGRLDLMVVMRSNDVVFGYRNDRAFAYHVHRMLSAELNVPVGTIQWHADSLHVYQRHYYLVDHYAKTGEKSVTLAEYAEMYPDSPFIER